jgi:hypothetical protein
MLVVRAIEGGADSLGEVVGTEKLVGLDYPTLTIDPLGLYGIEPRARFRQKAAYDLHSFAALFDLLVVRC